MTEYDFGYVGRAKGLFPANQSNLISGREYDLSYDGTCLRIEGENLREQLRDLGLTDSESYIELKRVKEN